MNRPKLLFLLVSALSLLALTLYYSYVLQETSHPMTQGAIYLSETDFDEEGVIALSGEWEFYWEQLLDPEQFLQGVDGEVRYAKVPGTWLQDLDGNSYGGKGYATYRARIEQIPPDTYFGLKKSNVRSAAKIFVNGELVLQDGLPASTLQAGIAGNKSEVVYFQIEEGTAEIIVQAANHEYIVGGMAKPIIFGKQKVLMQQHQLQLLFEFAMILVVLIIGLFYLLLYVNSRNYRNREPVTLPLALSCICFSMMSSTYSERILHVFFADLSLNFIFRFGHFMSVMSVILVLFVVNKVNPVFLSLRYRRIMGYFYGLFIVLLLFMPLEFYLMSVPIYLVVTVGLFLLIVIRMAVLYLRSQPHDSGLLEQRTLMLSVFGVILYWLDNSLYSFGVKSDMFLSFVATAVYSISLAALLIARHLKYYQQNEDLMVRLIDAFTTLDQTSKEAQRNEVAFLRAQIKPHFLFNALNSIISLCYTNAERAARLLNDLSKYLKLSFTLDPQADVVTISNELELIQTFVAIEKARFGERVHVVYDIDEEALGLRITPLIIEPLVENAIRHGVLKNKGGGKVKLTIRRLERSLCISVEDNGKGLNDRQVDDIQRIQHEQASPQGNGISLKNIQTRLQSVYQVKLNFMADANGTTVYFEIPIEEESPNGDFMPDSGNRGR
ncbi:histidine kinase [Paenibacillus sp. PL2-23]